MSIHAHPELPEFDYCRPASIEEASRFLFEHPSEAYPFLGGTDLFVRMREGAVCPQFLVDVKHLEGMKAIHYSPESGLAIGAAVNMNQVIGDPQVNRFYPLLVEACRTVASYQLRTRATIAGNICNASPAGDTIGACLVLNASLKVHGVDGWRSEPLATFFKGPGKTTLRSGDVVVAIEFPLPPAGAEGRYLKLGRNKLSDLAIVGATAFGYPDRSTHSGYHFRIALASVAPTPLVCDAAEELLSQSSIDLPALKESAILAQQACTPIDDVRSSAMYRSAMVRSLTFNALRSVWERLDNHH